MSILVLGSINTDLVVRGARLPTPGETVTGGEFYRSPGGKGANQAVAAARAGAVGVVFLGAVGDDLFGLERAVLAGEKVDADSVKVVPGAASGVALILVDEHGENLISVAPGANAMFTPEDVAALPYEIFQRARVFLASLESPLATVEAGLRRARSHRLQTILNPAPVSDPVATRAILSEVDLLTPNRGEAAQLAGVDTQTDGGLVQAARRLQELGCRSVVITLGADGCLVADEAIRRVPAVPVTAVDATAAGDAFCGALAVAMADCRTLIDAARWATCAAAISVTRRGAQPSLATRAEIDALPLPRASEAL
ncbi:MAG: ribokinase [Pirellulales bacterium]